MDRGEAWRWAEALLVFTWLASMYALGMACVWAWATLAGWL